MSGTISAARVLLMAAFLGMAVLVVSCRGNSKPSQAQLLIQSPPSAQELPLDLEALMTVEAIVPPPAVGGVSYQLGREALPAAYGLVIAVYPDAKTAERVFASPAPSKGIIGLIGPVIHAIEVGSPLWDGGPTVRCFEAPISAYNPLDDTKKRECDVVFRNFIVSVGLGRPGDVPLPAMQDEVPLLQAGVQHVERVLGGSAPSPAASATPTNTGSPTPAPTLAAASPTAGIAVTENFKPVGTYATMDEAIAKASDLGGFQVLPVLNLPLGFAVSFFNVLRPDFGPTFPISPANFRVEIGVRSDSGGLLITEFNASLELDAAPSELTVTPAGDFYDSGPGSPRLFTLVTATRTFGIQTTRGNLTPAQALAIMSGFH